MPDYNVVADDDGPIEVPRQRQSNPNLIVVVGRLMDIIDQHTRTESDVTEGEGLLQQLLAMIPMNEKFVQGLKAFWLRRSVDTEPITTDLPALPDVREVPSGLCLEEFEDLDCACMSLRVVV
ncbi:hypothetical protein HJC99_06675 [Candidatus Saccharibacteria bacterium]|nr:hypothetical protein [Candidatus Saccharibacteria bacterium]